MKTNESHTGNHSATRRTRVSFPQALEYPPERHERAPAWPRQACDVIRSVFPPREPLPPHFLIFPFCYLPTSSFMQHKLYTLTTSTATDKQLGAKMCTFKRDESPVWSFPLLEGNTAPPVAPPFFHLIC